MIYKNRLFYKIFHNFFLMGFFIVSLGAFVASIGCSSGGGGGGPKTEYHLTGYDGVESGSSGVTLSSSSHSGHEFYSEFPWFVNVTYQVLDNDSWGVSDLVVGDFKVLEDGKEVDQKVSEMNIRKRDTLPTDFTYTLKTVLFLDNTPSTALKLEKMKEAAQVIVDYLDEKQQQQVAIVAYDEAGDTTVIQDFTDNQSQLNTAIINLEPSFGVTDFYGAVIGSLSLWEDNESPSDPSFVQGFLVAVTDGLDTANLNDVDDAIAARGDKRVITVAVGADIASDVLDDLERLGNAGYYPVPKPDIEPDEAEGKKPEDENLCEWMLVVQQRMLAYADSFYWLRYKTDASSQDQDLDHSLVLSVVNNANKDNDAEVSGGFSSEDLFSGSAAIYFNATATDPDGIPEEVITIDPGQSDVTDDITALTYSRDSNNPSTYEWSSDDEGVVTVQADEKDSSKATITVVAPGETHLTVTDTANNVTQKLTVRVELNAPSYEFVKHEVQSEAPWFVDATFQVRRTYDEEDYDADNPWYNHWSWVTDLIREDFSIIENKGTAEEQLVDMEKSEVNLRKRDNIPSDYTYTLKTVLLIDNTPSIGSDNLDLIKEAAKSFVHRVFVNDPNDNSDSGPLLSQQGGMQQEIAIWTFTEQGDSTTVWYDFGSVEEDLDAAIDDIPRGYGPTDFYGGMIDALNLWDNDQKPRDGNTVLQQGVLIALTDGNHSLQGFYDRDAVLGEIGDKQVITVGVGDDLASQANVDDLVAFSNAGYYSVPDPGQEIKTTIKSDDGKRTHEVTYTSLEKTMMDIQDEIVEYADSFYWLDYKSYVTPASDCDDREDIKISLNNNSNTGSGSAIWSSFKSCDFFDGAPNQIYINSTASNPWGEDGPIDLSYVMLGDIPMVNPTFPMEAVTYKPGNTPDYEWFSGNESIILVDVDDTSYANSQATLVLPADKTNGSTTIRVHDIGNSSNKWLTVNVEGHMLPQPILYYPFNGNADDETGNGYDAQAFGASLTTDRFGNPNSAYLFNGTNNYIAIQNLHYAEAGVIDAISVCAWFKTASSKDQNIVSFDGSEYWVLGLKGWAYFGSSSASESWANSNVSDENYNDDSWHFICGTFSDSQNSQKLYIDGNLVDSVSTSGALGTGVTRYGFIGSGSEADVYNGDRNNNILVFDGRIDDIIIFDQALSSQEVADLYDAMSN